MTPNELIKYNKELEEYKDNKETFNKEQENACLSKSDASLFYKIYLALLEFTNNKYKINNKVKIYNQININPESIVDIIKKYWEEKDKLTQEFISENPYNFTEEELSITNSFSKGIRNTYIIAKYEKEYTAILDGKKIYMVKGINCNIDKIIPSTSLPYFVETSLIEFKDTIVYDSILFGSPIEFGLEMKKMIDDELKKGFRNYHL